MNRFKFRFWDNDKKEWLDSSEIEFDSIDSNWKIGVPFNIYQKNITIQQFTGLKDKNGKDIYEGDILKTPGWRGSTEICEVEWTETNASDDMGVDTVGFMRFDEYGAPEIIGNIFESPELIK